MARQLTEAQMEIVEERWRMRIVFGEHRISKADVRNVTVSCWIVGPGLAEGVTAQLIGSHRIYANRYAAEENRPRAMQKTPEQLEMLQELWEKDPYPTSGETILATHDTGLSKAQVNHWFDNERKKVDKRGEILYTRHRRTDPNVAAKMWRAYKKDPNGYAEDLRSGAISKKTGERLYREC